MVRTSQHDGWLTALLFPHADGVFAYQKISGAFMLGAPFFAFGGPFLFPEAQPALLANINSRIRVV
jgi:hypothetical protein